MLRCLFCISLFYSLIVSKELYAQDFGGFPPGTQWQQTNTDTARIIFEPSVTRQALRVSRLVHALAADTTVHLHGPLKKINIVLHNHTTDANGYVALGPFRSEYYLVPGANIFDFGTLPWHENLAIHEYRHVQQYNSFNKGLTKIFSVFGGQNGRALANALSIPDWFFEGDAVYAETAFTGLGRGRQPLFLSAYNSLLQDDRRYSWMKLRNGSYKDYVPDHYNLGYLLVNYGYRKYGSGFWSTVTDRASRFKGLFYPFQKGVQYTAHEDFKMFRTQALNFYKEKITVPTVAAPEGAITDFFYPQPVGTDSIVCVKSSYKELPAFYLKTARGERRITLRNITSENWFRYAAGKIVYTSFTTSKRWSLTNYSDIIVFDLKSGKKKQLTQHGKYFTPTLSPDGRRLISVFYTDSLQTELRLLRATDGGLLKKFTTDVDGVFVNPVFLNNTQVLTGIRDSSGQITLQRIDLETGLNETLITAQPSAMGDFFPAGDTLYFTASFTGNDDLFAFRLLTRELFQLTHNQTGSYNPAVVGTNLMWSQFTSRGRRLQQQPIDQLLWKPFDLSTKNTATYPVASITDNIREQQNKRPFTIKKYPKGYGLFNVHSWDPGGSIYSNNILNTLASTLYYRYNSAERTHTAGFTATYGGFYPVLTTTLEQTFSRHIRNNGLLLVANESEARFGYYIPLNFTKGNTYKTLSFGTSYVINQFQPIGASKEFYDKTLSQYLQHYVGWTQQLPRARQHIYPKLGYSVLLQYRHRIDKNGFQKNGSLALYLPGFSKTHSLVLSASAQQVDTSNRIFSNRFTVARGYPQFFYAKMWNAGFNYHMPLLYPDFGVANIVYLLRVRSNFFFDYTQVRSIRFDERKPMRSAGVELYLDTKLWNQLPASFGLRYSYLLDREFAFKSWHQIEFVVPVDLIPF